MTGALALAASAAAALVLAADASAPVAFSSLSPGELQRPWRALHVANVKPAEIALVADEGATVLRVRAAAASGSAAQALDAPARGVSLAWRWKIDRVVEGADLARKSGDDFAARVNDTDQTGETVTAWFGDFRFEPRP